MSFRKIDVDTWPRRSHYEYYRTKVKTSFQLTKEIDVTEVKNFCEQNDMKFYPVMIYLIMVEINKMPEFRMGIDSEGNLGYFDVSHPQYTVFHKDDCTFSDMWSYYDEDPRKFYETYMKDMKEFGDVKGIKARPDRPECAVSISSVPWISFSGVSFDTPGPGPFFMPIINFGKYEEKEGRYVMPFAVFINHAAADGYHVAKLMNGVQDNINRVSEIFDETR